MSWPGVVYSAIGLGVSVSNLMAGFLANQYGYAAGFTTMAGLGLLGTLFFWLLVPETQALPTASPLTGRLPLRPAAG